MQAEADAQDTASSRPNKSGERVAHRRVKSCDHRPCVQKPKIGQLWAVPMVERGSPTYAQIVLEKQDTPMGLKCTDSPYHARLYEGGPLVNPVVRSLTPQLTQLPGERCRVKRLSKVTGVNS